MLMKGGEAISEHAPLALAAMAVLAVLAFRLASHPRVRERAALAAWRVPRLGEALRLYHLAQFYRSMGMLLDGGMPVTASLRLARELLAASMRPGLDVASRLVNEGLPASVALTRAGLATPVAVSLMQVGERGGRLGAMMDRVAAFHDAQLAQRIDVATRAFEPLLMAMIGVVIGTLVVLLYMPVFDLANSL
jgi:general secretion pathway protein F